MPEKGNSMKIEVLKIVDLKPYENNPRKNLDAIDAVANSLRRFGWQQPIVIDKDNVIVAGHTRYEAAKRLGLGKVPCKRAEDLTEEQIKAYRLADNKTSELAGWDFDKLEKELDELADFNMEDFGFTADEGFNDGDLEALFMDAPEKESKPKTVKCPHCGEEFEV